MTILFVLQRERKGKKNLYLHFLCLSFSLLWVNFFYRNCILNKREICCAHPRQKNATALFSERQRKRELRTNTKTRIGFLYMNGVLFLCRLWQSHTIVFFFTFKKDFTFWFQIFSSSESVLLYVPHWLFLWPIVMYTFLYLRQIHWLWWCTFYLF